MNRRERCECGKPLHYSSKLIEEIVTALVAKQGRFIPVSVGARTLLVSRHYIALHGVVALTGVKTEELSEMGFKEVNGGQ